MLIVALLSTVFVFAQNTEDLQDVENVDIEKDVESAEVLSETTKKDSIFKDGQFGINYAPYIMIDPYISTMFANGVQIDAASLHKKGINQVKWGYVYNIGFYFPSSITMDFNGESSKISLSNISCFLGDINFGMIVAYNSYTLMEMGIDFFWLSIENTRSTLNLGFYIRGGFDVNMSEKVALAFALKASMNVNWMFNDEKRPEIGIIPSVGLKFKF